MRCTPTQFAGGGASLVKSAGVAGGPAQPVFHEGCAYAVWAGSGVYIRACTDSSSDVIETYPDLASANDLSFRVNRKVIVVNDNVSGDVFLPDDGMEQVTLNWDVVEAQLDDEHDDEDSTDEEPLEEDAAPEFTEDNHPPVANPDKLRVRAGRATTLRVLANDFDPDGNVMTVALDEVPDDWSIGLTRGERAVRVEVPEDATGSFRFTYRAFDGRVRSNVAEVAVQILAGDTVNEPPEKPLRTPRLNIAERASVVYSALQGWTDPEGDQVYLKSASARDEGMRVDYRQDGTVTVTDLGTAGPGLREVEVIVSDGVNDAAGMLKVQVGAYNKNQPPVANADFYWGTVGESLLIEPMSNDTDPNGDDLRLTQVLDSAPDTEITRDLPGGSFQFSAPTAGPYFVQYTITDGPLTSRNEVRIDIIDPAGQSAPPVAENDLVVVPEGSAAAVDVLGNDFDPLGGVLVILEAEPPEDSGLSVSIIDHAQLRVSAPAGLSGPERFTYTVSNGHATPAVASVLVLPEPAGTSTLPPIATDDEAMVRAGDIVAVPVLRNDYSPTNLEFTLLPDVDVNSDIPLGEAFVSGNLLRFRAGSEPGDARVTYTIQDSTGNVASAEARITVVDLDKENQAPQPRPVTARVIAGNSVRIAVPADGMDGDGDLVLLSGFASSPQEGQAAIDRGYIEYSAPRGASGTDTFSYTVQDRFGAEGAAQVRVGIAPAPRENRNPIAVVDNISARPGVEIEIEPVLNDVDPDNDTLMLVTDSIEPVDESVTVETSVEGGKVRVVTPDKAGVLQLYYRVSDGNGGSARGVISILIDADVPLAAPIAVDDPLSPADILGQSEVRVPVLVNDSDPDGSTQTLTITAVEEPARIEGAEVIVPVADERQVILYTITDPDDETGRAAVIVPGAAQTPPALNPELVPATITAGDPLTIDLREYVLTRAGREALITTATKVTAGPGWDRADLVTGEQEITFTADVEFVGDTFVSFEVTDGETIEDPRGLKATLSLPIVVESAELNDHQPEFRPSEIAVEAGEAAESFDLGPMVEDPDPGDHEALQFSVGAVSGPFSVEGDGRSLRVSAPADADPGTRGSVEVTVTDGSTDPVTKPVPLQVLSSTRPLPTTRDATFTEGRSGETTSVNLEDYTTNPFADRGESLRVVGSPAISPEGSGQVSVRGMTVDVTPAPSFDGQMVVTYQVADATGDPSRYATGVIRVTVKGQPRAPENVTAVSNASKSATVSWTPGDLRGGVLEGFTVHWTGGGEKKCGIRTVCELDGVLENTRDYTFTVTQTTEAGSSDHSSPSNVVRPDVRPNAPSVPVATFGDEEISLTWRDGGVPDGGSPVDRYTVEVQPPVNGATEKTVTGGTSLTWTGLRNGVAYSFAVKAHNQSEHESVQSGFSAPEIPAGQSGPPRGHLANPLKWSVGGPTVMKDPVSNATPRATIYWGAPFDGNGDTSYTYELRRVGTTTIVYSGPATSTTVTMTVDVEDQSFEARATNKSGIPSEWSGRSNAVRAFQPPGTPGSFTLTPTGKSHTVRFDFSPAVGNGARPSEMSYRWSSGTASGTVTSGTAVTSDAFRHDGAVTVQLRAISTVSAEGAPETAEGAAVTASVSAYGPPIGPSMSCSAATSSVTCTWSGGAANGRPTTFQANTSQSASGAKTVSGSGKETFTGLGASTSRTYCVRAVATEGGTTAWRCDSATTPAPPPPPSYRFSDSGTRHANGLQLLNLQLNNWNSSSVVRCEILGEGGHASWWGNFRVNSSGYYSGAAQGNEGGNGRAFSAASLINQLNDGTACRQQ